MKHVVIVVLVSACWRSPPPAAPSAEPASPPIQVRSNARTPLSDAELAMQAMEEFTDRFCNCNDAQCAQIVMEDMTRWSQDMSGRNTEPPKLNDDEARRAAEIGERMAQCMQNAMSGSAPSPPPPPTP